MEEYSIPYLAFCAAVGYYAKTKGRSPWCWGLASLFFSPILAGIILALCKDLTDRHRIDALSMEQRQIKDRMSMNEVNNNRRFQTLERQQVQGQISGRPPAYLPPAAPAGQVPLPAEDTAYKSEERMQAAATPVYDADIIYPDPSENQGGGYQELQEAPKLKFCHNCGQKLPLGAKFCSNCGAEQEAEKNL